MDNVDNVPVHTISPHGITPEHFKDLLTQDNDNESGKHRHCVSLPLYYDQGEVCTFASRRGMECMPLRTSSGAYHYHVNDQTKSLQELQNEVGALLEFRDLVIETFPDLKNKMASISASSTGVPSASSLASRREWEPGIRVRRKLTHKEAADIHNSSSLTRSRSNSHSGKKEPKSGEGNNASVIQDSVFSTETSSSKETHSATSTHGAGATTAIGGNNSTSGFQRVSSHEAEDELWNLLDVIHRQSTRLRDEMEHLRLMEVGKSPDSHHHLHHDHHTHDQYIATHETNGRDLTDMFQLELNRINAEDMTVLRKDRDRLLDKLAEMEAEVVAGRIRSNHMEDEVNALNLVKRDLEEKLRAALSQKLELHNRLNDLHQSDRNDIPASFADSPRTRQRSSMAVRKVSSPDTSTYHSKVLGNKIWSNSSAVKNTFSAVIVKSSTSSTQIPNSKPDSDMKNELFGDVMQQSKQDYTLGRLDGLVSSPNRCSKVRVADSRKIAAILLQTNIVELQRHLLTITVQNQALQQKFVNMAYKHPQLLIGEKDECDKVDSDPDENVMKKIENYNDQNKYRSTFKLNIFDDNKYRDGSMAQAPVENSCRLIGNVKPNLIKTWERLNGTAPPQADATSVQRTKTYEKTGPQQEYNRCIYFSNNHMFEHKNSSPSKNNDSFVIKRPTSQSSHFYDSIDNESVVTQDDDDQLIASLCDDMEHGGEAMAEYISLIEKKEKLCWSIDS